MVRTHFEINTNRYTAGSMINYFIFVSPSSASKNPHKYAKALSPEDSMARSLSQISAGFLNAFGLAILSI